MKYKVKDWLDAIFRQQVVKYTALAESGDSDAARALADIQRVKVEANGAFVAKGADGLEVYASRIEESSGYMANARFLLTVMAGDVRSGRISFD